MKKQGQFRKSLTWLGASLLVVSLFAGPAFGADDVMPAPRKMPRTPVNRQALENSGKSNTLQSRDVSGTATVIDGEQLRINNINVRLFGIVPPQLSASYGPQARAAIDDLIHGQTVNCHVRDRDHDGRYLAICNVGSNKSDLALHLLQRGLAVTARGSLQPTELAEPYIAAEQAAQAQKIGLWSVVQPPAATVSATPAVKTDAAVPPLPSEIKKKEAAAEKPAAPVEPAVTSPAATPATAAAEPVQKLRAPTITANNNSFGETEASSSEGVGAFFARYQLLITGLVMLTTAFGILIALVSERRKDKRDEMKAIAAALRGELLAARAVCMGRLKTWTDMDEANGSWPRIRTTLYQAYVGRLGWLGAMLARQIASIYGQASDYSAYFNPNNPMETRNEGASKRKALQTLVGYIEEVLPKLATIEQSGKTPKGPVLASLPAPSPANALLTYADHGPSVHQEIPYEPQQQNDVRQRTTSSLQNFVQKLIGRRAPSTQRAEDAMPDYTALIEEEMARMSSEEEARHSQSSNVRKLR